MAEALDIPNKHVVISEALLPDADPRLLCEAQRGHKETQAPCTGHAPNLERALERALGTSCNAVSPLKKAGAASLELLRYQPPRARLVWLLEPGALRRLGHSTR